MSTLEFIILADAGATFAIIAIIYYSLFLNTHMLMTICLTLYIDKIFFRVT